MVNFEAERAYTHTIPDLIREWAIPTGLTSTDRTIVTGAMREASTAFDRRPTEPNLQRIFVSYLLLKSIKEAGRSGDALTIVSTVINAEPSLLDTAGVELEERNVRDLLSDAAHEEINALERFAIPALDPIENFDAEIQRRRSFKHKLFEQLSQRPPQERR